MRKRRAVARCAFAACLMSVCALGCSGEIVNPGADPGENAQPGLFDDVVVDELPLPPGRTVADPLIHQQNSALGLRRLTPFEYVNTVRDLLGVDVARDGLNDAPEVQFFNNNAHVQRVGLPELEAYDRKAQAVAAQGVVQLELPAGCTLQGLTEPCVTDFLTSFLSKAFRRPARDEEIARYARLYATLAATDSGETALRDVVHAILLAPSFLYRMEIGDAQGALSGFELASRLSYLVWGSMPDANLTLAASDGTLRDPSVLGAQAGRLLADPRAKAGLLEVLYQWLALDQAEVARKGNEIVEGLPEDVQQQLEQETRAFVTDALLTPNASLLTLYSAKHSFVTQAAAEIYGMESPQTSMPIRVELDSATRRGLFTQPLLLSAHTKEAGYSVVQMGRFFRERVLCQEVPEPPPDVDTTIESDESTQALTQREKLNQHSTHAVCAACHKFLDPAGFAFLPYDPVGRYRPNDENGTPYDTSGTLTQLDGRDVAFDDAVGMLDAIARSQAAKACFAKKFLEYGLGRTLAEMDVPSLKWLVVQVEDSGGDFEKFVSDLVSTPAFRRRGPVE